MIVSKSLDPADQKQCSVSPDLGPSCLQVLLADVKGCCVIKNLFYIHVL